MYVVRVHVKSGVCGSERGGCVCVYVGVGNSEIGFPVTIVFLLVRFAEQIEE